MGAPSGRYAVVNAFPTMRGWSINETAQGKAFAASNTYGGTGRRKNVRAWSGQVQCYGHTPAAMPGETFSFLGYTAPTDHTAGANGYKYSGSAIVDSVAIALNWASHEPIGYTLNFSGSGALSVASGAAILDAEIPDPPEMCGCKVTFDPDGLTETEIGDLTQATLTITASNIAIVNSSQVSGGKCWTGRRGGNIDWTLSLSQENDDRGVAAAPDIGSDGIVKVYVNATEFWLLKWGHVEQYNGLQVNRESAAVIARTIQLGMQAIPPAGAELGSIALPDTTEFWPFAA